MTTESLKVLVVGDATVGKTSILLTVTTGHFPTEYVPTVVDTFRHNIMVGQKVYSLGLWDTAGQEEFANLRQKSYRDTDVFVLCFSVIDEASWENLRTKWLPELEREVPQPAIILVGTKIDLRGNTEHMAMLKSKKIVSEEFVEITEEKGKNLASIIKAFCYTECSAIKNIGLQEIWKNVITAHEANVEMKKQLALEEKKKNKKCIII